MKNKIRLNYSNVIVKSEDVLDGVFRNVPAVSGCYAFFSAEKQCLYVGQSHNIYHRVRFGHRFTQKYNKAKFLYWWESDNRLRFEHYLISYFSPIYNKSK
ncbi:GIY-YIG nuclease family protein [Plesiomonas shigelloides]|uniref:GIY-YIG nuclease family protein n=1 Tax=Plesiomonas shigelloides TaxID=703 RepID=UPI000E0FD9BA